MNEPKSLGPDSNSVITHVQLMQGVIERMARNSSACKTWCISIVSAILVVSVGEGMEFLAFLSLLPIYLFRKMDTKYLALERGFRNSYNAFVNDLHAGELVNPFKVAPNGVTKELEIEVAESWSVFDFYRVQIIVCVSIGVLVPLGRLLVCWHSS